MREEDPALASHMSTSAPEKDAEPARGPRAPRRIALGFGGAVLGMVVLVGAVSLGYSLVSILLGVVGFALTVGGILYALSRPSSALSGRGRGSTQAEEGQRERDRWLGFFHSGSGAPLG